MTVSEPLGVESINLSDPNFWEGSEHAVSGLRSVAPRTALVLATTAARVGANAVSAAKRLLGRDKLRRRPDDQPRPLHVRLGQRHHNVRQLAAGCPVPD